MINVEKCAVRFLFEIIIDINSFIIHIHSYQYPKILLSTYAGRSAKCKCAVLRRGKQGNRGAILILNCIFKNEEMLSMLNGKNFYEVRTFNMSVK